MLASDPMIEGPGFGLTGYLVDTHLRGRRRETRPRDGMDRLRVGAALGLSEGEWVLLQGDRIVERGGNPVVIGSPTTAVARERGRALLPPGEVLSKRGMGGRARAPSGAPPFPFANLPGGGRASSLDSVPRSGARTHGRFTG